MPVQFDGVTREPRPAGALLLSVNGQRAGLVTRENLAFIERLEKPLASAFSLKGETLTLTLPAASDAFLADLAAALWRRHAFFQWRNEALDVLAEDDATVIAHAERGLFRFLGLTTRCVYAVASTPSGKFWLGKRSAHKAIDPGLYDTLASGLIAAGETVQEALIRETAEESGLTPEVCQFHPGCAVTLIERRVREGWMREITYTYRADVAEDVTPQNTDGEVERFDAVDTEELKDCARRGLLTFETVEALTVLGLLPKTKQQNTTP